MKRNLASILFIIAMMIIISHDVIPHFHPEKADNNVALSHTTDHHHDDDADPDRKNHFPPHRHFFSDGEFVAQRNSISLNKVIKASHNDYGLICTNQPGFPDDTYFVGFIRENRKPLSPFPFIISVNSTRGSPHVF